MKEFSHMKVIITGTASGIGRGLAEAYAEKGATVFAIDLQPKEFEYGNIVSLSCDVSHGTQVAELFNYIKKDFGSPDILINNAAIATFNKPITEITDEQFRQVIDVNLCGTFYCAKAFVKCRSKNNSYGRIINIASTRWLQSEPNWEAYGASKGGVVALTHALAISLSNTGITVNAISPGWIDTGHYSITESDHRQHPSGRVGQVIDIIKAAFYLSDPDNNFITGTNMVIDGGMSKKMFYE